jgi:hypothetical protein
MPTPEGAITSTETWSTTPEEEVTPDLELIEEEVTDED